jgi:hypothetical protein
MIGRKRPSAAFWATVAVVVLAAYVLTAPLSELIVLRIVFHGWIGEEHRDSVIAVIRGFYFPVHWLRVNGPWPISAPLRWYFDLWLGDIGF